MLNLLHLEHLGDLAHDLLRRRLRVEAREPLDTRLQHIRWQPATCGAAGCNTWDGSLQHVGRQAGAVNTPGTQSSAELITYYSRLTADNRLLLTAPCFLTAHCPLPTAHCPLLTAPCSLPTAHCSLPTAHCALLTAHCPLPTAHCALRPAHCPLLTAHCSLRTAPCSLRPAHCALFYLTASESNI